MKWVKRYSVGLTLSLFAIFLTLSSSIAFADRSDVEAFVTRFYQQCLDRNPEPSGLNGWVTALLTGTLSGSDVAFGFIYSDEFQAKNTSNEDYLTVLYRAFFDRYADPAGWSGWLGLLESQGVEARTTVLDGFLVSQEFANLCNRYGIIAYGKADVPGGYGGSDNSLIGTWNLSSVNGQPLPPGLFLTYTFTADTVTITSDLDCVEVYTYDASNGVIKGTSVISVTGSQCCYGSDCDEDDVLGSYTNSGDALTIIVTDETLTPSTATFVFTKAG